MKPDELRALEQNAPNVTPKAIRAALVQAAATIDEYERRMAEGIKHLEEAVELRISHMDTESRVIGVADAIRARLHRALSHLRG